MKKFVSILLAMLIAAGLFVPAMAEGEDVPLRVSISGNYTSTSKRIARGETITLECSFEQPEGFEGEPSIEWTVGGKVVGTGRRLELAIDENIEGDKWEPVVNVSVKVTYTLTDEDGEVLAIKQGSSSTRVYVALTAFAKVLQTMGTILVVPFVVAVPTIIMPLGMLLMAPLALLQGIWKRIISLFN